MRNLIFRFSFAFLIICSAYFTDPRNVFKSSALKSQPDDHRPVPPAQELRADRFGVYNWNVNDSAFPRDGSIDLLNWGANKVAELGSRTIRVYMGTLDIHHVYDGYTDSEYSVERDEIKRLGEYLLGAAAFAGKTFIILNWEGDNAIHGFSNKRSVWDSYTQWVRARAEGVKLAMRKYPSSAARLFSGLEFNSIKSLNSRKQMYCGTPVADPVNEDPLKNRCVIDYVAPRVEVDYYSYSAWDSVNDKQGSPNEDLKRRFKSDLSFALSKIKANRPPAISNSRATIMRSGASPRRKSISRSRPRAGPALCGFTSPTRAASIRMRDPSNCLAPIARRSTRLAACSTPPTR